MKPHIHENLETHYTKRFQGIVERAIHQQLLPYQCYNSE